MQKRNRNIFLGLLLIWLLLWGYGIVRYGPLVSDYGVGNAIQIASGDEGWGDGEFDQDDGGRAGSIGDSEDEGSTTTTITDGYSLPQFIIYALLLIGVTIAMIYYGWKAFRGNKSG